MPIVDLFRKKGKIVDVDSSKGRTDVWELVKSSLLPHSDSSVMIEELSDQSQCLLGLKKWPKKVKSVEGAEAAKQRGRFGVVWVGQN